MRQRDLKLTSNPGESERDFQIRVRDAQRVARDAAVDAVRKKYAAKQAQLEEQQRRAAASVERESAQASQQKLQTGLSVGATILGAIFGRKAIGVGSLGRATTAARGVGRSMKETDDIRRANENLDAVEERARALEEEVAQETRRITEQFDAAGHDRARVTRAEARAGLGAARRARLAARRATERSAHRRIMAARGQQHQPDEIERQGQERDVPRRAAGRRVVECAERDAFHQRRHHPLDHPAPRRVERLERDEPAGGTRTQAAPPGCGASPVRSRTAVSVVRSCTRKNTLDQHVEQARVRRQQVEDLRRRGEERQQHRRPAGVLERRSGAGPRSRSRAKTPARTSDPRSRTASTSAMSGGGTSRTSAPSRSPPRSATVRKRQGRTNASRSGLIVLASAAARG